MKIFTKRVITLYVKKFLTSFRVLNQNLDKALMQYAAMKSGKLRRLYSLEGTAEILEYIDRNPGCIQGDLKVITLSKTIVSRLTTFREYGLIHQKEELTLTELGKRYLSAIRAVEALEENG